MKKWMLTVSLLLGFAGLCSPAFADEKVAMQLIADVSKIEPGTPFTVGIKFTIEPGYHIYWKNPGDSGLATQVKLRVPDGFKVGEITFPVPEILNIPGGIVNYGYENEVVLTARITPPSSVRTGVEIAVVADATWLVCKDDCTPGKAEAGVALRVADEAVPANAAIFKEWSGKMPVTEDRDDVASLTKSKNITNQAGSIAININWKKTPADVQFVPAPLKRGDIANIKSVTTGDSTKITFGITSYMDDEPISGLIVFTSASGVRTGLELSLPFGGDPGAKD